MYATKWQQTDRERTYFIQESTFCVPYTLPDKRVVFLRGKIDSAFTIQTSQKSIYIYLQENKCKVQIDQESLPETLFGNLQIGIYLTVLDIINKSPKGRRHKYFQAP